MLTLFVLFRLFCDRSLTFFRFEFPTKSAFNKVLTFSYELSDNLVVKIEKISVNFGSFVRIIFVCVQQRLIVYSSNRHLSSVHATLVSVIHCHVIDKMNNCTVCDDSFRNDNPNKVICDGVCRQSFHAECVNFSKNSLLCYREMPNLQWLCDGCIIQTRSSNVSFHPVNKANSTVVFPTSSPSSYIDRSLISAKRNRNANPKNSSVFLINRSTNVVQNSKNANDLINEMQSKGLVKPPSANELNSPITSVAIQPVGGQPETPQKLEDVKDVKEIRKEPLELENPPINSTSFADVVTKSPIAEPVPGEDKDSTIQPRNDLLLIGSPSSVTHKIVYVSKFHRSVTEKEVVDYLLSKDIITSPDDVSCKILVSPNVNLDSVSFVSFKITVSSKIFHSVVNSKLWPDGVIVREFVNR